MTENLVDLTENLNNLAIYPPIDDSAEDALPTYDETVSSKSQSSEAAPLAPSTVSLNIGGVSGEKYSAERPKRVLLHFHRSFRQTLRIDFEFHERSTRGPPGIYERSVRNSERGSILFSATLGSIVQCENCSLGKIIVIFILKYRKKLFLTHQTIFQHSKFPMVRLKTRKTANFQILDK
ncbi:hypothetical protein CAEBREN_22445 [Caenorhabditis brenneri]|uniref:Uncharacterized protein n=1 Tax=Caenorhabditis brenneri TaxID=135651 RepID=G0MUW6_CAEBE|nr:hypothetical protein CAEBREN_22445 [Caenorhabditis brenneri]